MAPMVFDEADRRMRDSLIQEIPESQAALFHAVALQIKHDTAGLHTAVRGLIELYDRQHTDAQAALALLQAQERRLTTVAADLALLRAQVEPFGRMLVRLDSGLTILEGLEQADVQHLSAVIGPTDPADPRTIREHLRDQDTQRTQMDRRVTGRLNWLAGAVALVAVILAIVMITVLTTPPTVVFGG